MFSLLLTKEQTLRVVLGWNHTAADLPTSGAVVLAIPAPMRDTGHTHARITFVRANRYTLEFTKELA